MFLERLRQHGQDFVLAQDQDVLAVDLDVGPGVLSEQDLVADLDVEGDLGAVLEDLAVADGEDLALLRLLLGRVGDDDPALGRLLLLDAADQQTVVKRTYFRHVLSPLDQRTALGAGAAIRVGVAMTGTGSDSRSAITCPIERLGLAPRRLAQRAAANARLTTQVRPIQGKP